MRRPQVGPERPAVLLRRETDPCDTARRSSLGSDPNHERALRRAGLAPGVTAVGRRLDRGAKGGAARDAAEHPAFIR